MVTTTTVIKCGKCGTCVPQIEYYAVHSVSLHDGNVTEWFCPTCHERIYYYIDGGFFDVDAFLEDDVENEE